MASAWPHLRGKMNEAGSSEPGAVFGCGDQYGHRNSLRLSPWLQGLMYMSAGLKTKEADHTNHPASARSFHWHLSDHRNADCPSQKSWDWDFYLFIYFCWTILPFKPKLRACVCVCVWFKKFLRSSKSHLRPQPNWRVVSRGLALFGTLLFSWRLHMLLRCFLDSSPSLTTET